MSDHRFTRRVVGVVAIIGLSGIAVASLATGNDGDILISVVLGIVAVVTATLKGIAE